YIKLYNLDTSHFTGQLWNKGLKDVDKTARVKLNTILQENTNFNCNTLKKRLLAEGIKEYKCECCGITEWQGEEITLELHHINGNHYDNRLENLQLLCPNCHSQTDSYRKRYAIRGIKVDKPKKFYNTYTTICANPNCQKEFQTDSKRKKYCCRECYNQVIKTSNNVNLISKEKLNEFMQKCSSIKELAEELNTSRTLVRNYLKKYDLYEFFKEKYATNTLHSVSVLQYDLNGNFLKEWDCIADAETTLNIHKSISKCCRGQRKSAGGFKWKYKENII
ncbi:MAG: hypothetical protein K2H20_02950, partial [Bacilli bacterium]|nr:hypothetical protein [Bacilli bacterium]